MFHYEKHQRSDEYDDDDDGDDDEGDAVAQS